VKITLAQLNPIVGDVQGNLGKAWETIAKHGKETDLIIFPELFLSGYPPRDLLERPGFVYSLGQAVKKLLDVSKKYPDCGIIIGSAVRTEKRLGNGLYNSAIFIHNGKVLLKQNKSLLPTYDVFDEARYFDPSFEAGVLKFKEHTLGITVCEDMWKDPELYPNEKYNFDPLKELVLKGATMLINISASPYDVDKEHSRFKLINNHVKRYGLPFIFVNQVGANDELVFDGKSMFMDRHGIPVKVLDGFKENVCTVETAHAMPESPYRLQDRIESVYQALVLGTKDYMRKCGFSSCVIGLSGGIDSSVVASIAKAAVGEKNVIGVSMPSAYTSKESKKYARELADNLGINFMEIPISPVYSAYKKTMSELFKGKSISVAEQNIQARIRGNMLMALSNKGGHIVISTGNKSELATGYCTLYGDMSGGLAMISDVPKTMVYKLAAYINRLSKAIPQGVIDRPPSAELKPGQRTRTPCRLTRYSTRYLIIISR
jgi:NAD+ synthase (glutamine-hydrolysing)